MPTLPTKETLREAWLATMIENRTDGHFRLLPSEAAAIVGATLGVDHSTVLLSLSTKTVSGMANQMYPDPSHPLTERSVFGNG